MNKSDNSSTSFLAQSQYVTTQYRKRYANYIFAPHNLTVYEGTVLTMSGRSILELNGELELGCGYPEQCFRSTILRLDHGSGFIVKNSKCRIAYGANIHLFAGAHLSVDANCSIGENCRILCYSNITIGEHCVIDPDVTIADSDLHTIIENGEEQARCSKGIEIGNHVWIGIGSKILKDVKIGDKSIVLPGSTVTEDIPGGVIVGGNPATILKYNIDWEE